MNLFTKYIEAADAFIFIADRTHAHDPNRQEIYREALDLTQFEIFEQWKSGLQDFPIVAFGITCPRNSSGARVIAARPMALCADLKAVEAFLKHFDTKVSSGKFRNVKNAAFAVFLSNLTEAKAVRAMIGKLTGAAKGRRQ